MGETKHRVSRHNGRAGKHGVYNPKHNDRQFDVAHADNIDGNRTNHNLYWDWQNGLRNHEENLSGQYPSFSQVERTFYEQRYGDYLAGQAARNAKAGHSKRNRMVNDLLADSRICPEETIYQIGKEGDCPPPEVLTTVVQEFMNTLMERFGSHMHILDWALHLDETSPHIHARQVFDVENRYGEIEPKQEKALEALGIPLPFPDKKPCRQNNRKISFDSMCRELLLNICEEHGLAVERDAIYGGQTSREKNDYIIEAQRERIAELEKRNAELTADNEAQSRLLSQAKLEWQAKSQQLADADTVIEAITDTVYREAVAAVAVEAIRETQREQLHLLEQQDTRALSSETKLRDKERRLLHDWLTDTAKRLKQHTQPILQKVFEKLKLPDMRAKIKTRIKEQARPTVHEMLQNYARHSGHTNTPETKAHRGDER